MGLRPLPPAPLMAKWPSGSVAKSLCAQVARGRSIARSLGRTDQYVLGSFLSC